ncbi:MAG: DUF58 domain-containing protein [Chloroflexi bacterium]|nr:DUF58 domain-containing protein [Chloroflexota bacterium]
MKTLPGDHIPPRNHSAASGFLREHIDEIVLVGMMLGLYPIAVNTQIGWLYLLCGVLLALIIVSITVPRIILKHIMPVKILPPRVFEGDQFQVTAEITNRGKYNAYFLLLKDKSLNTEDKKPERTAGFDMISAGDTSSVHYTDSVSLRGVYPLAGLKVECSYPFGFFPGSRSFQQDGELVVYPHALPLSHGLIRGSEPIHSAQRSARHLAGQSFDFMGIREYQSGEPMKMIHWPSTARAGKLMVKEFRIPSRAALDIMLDNSYLWQAGRGHKNTLEIMVRIAASLGEFLLSHQLSFNFLYQDGDTVTRLQTPGRFIFLEKLARMQSSGKLSLEEMLGQSQKLISKSRPLLIITPEQASPETILSLPHSPNLTYFLLIKATDFILPGQKLPQDADEKKYDSFCRSVNSSGGYGCSVGKDDNPVKILERLLEKLPC